MKKLKSGNWTSMEIAFLRESYMELTDEELGRCLNRKTASIRYKRVDERLLRIKHYNYFDKLKIIEMYKKNIPVKKISKELKICKTYIYWLCRGIKQKRKEWTEEEKQFLKENYSNKKTKELSKELKRTVGSIIAFACKNDLKKSPEHIEIIKKENARNWKKNWL